MFLKSNLLEYITLGLIILGLPTIGLMYGGWKAGVTVFILASLSLGVLSVINDVKNNGGTQ